MKIGFFAGSFDPFTTGHLHVVKIASKLFDKVIVGVCVNPTKTRRFEKTLMRDAINELLKSEGLENCECVDYDGFTVDTAVKMGANFLIRGVRNAYDYDFEERLALINFELSGLETIFVRAGELSMISSSMVAELIKNGKDYSKYVHKIIAEAIETQKK